MLSDNKRYMYLNLLTSHVYQQDTLRGSWHQCFFLRYVLKAVLCINLVVYNSVVFTFSCIHVKCQYTHLLSISLLQMYSFRCCFHFSFLLTVKCHTSIWSVFFTISDIIICVFYTKSAAQTMLGQLISEEEVSSTWKFLLAIIELFLVDISVTL